MRIGDLSAAVTTADRRRGTGELILPPTPLSLRFSLCSLRAERSRQKTPWPRRLSPGMFRAHRALHGEPTPPRSLIRSHPPLRRPVTRHLRLICRLRVVSLLGRVVKQLLPLALNRLLLSLASGKARPLVHRRGVQTFRRTSHGGYRF